MTRMGFRNKVMIDKACKALGTYTSEDVYCWLQEHQWVSRVKRKATEAVHFNLPNRAIISAYLCQDGHSVFVKYVREGNRHVKKYLYVEVK